MKCNAQKTIIALVVFVRKMAPLSPMVWTVRLDLRVSANAFAPSGPMPLPGGPICATEILTTLRGGHMFQTNRVYFYFPISIAYLKTLLLGRRQKYFDTQPTRYFPQAMRARMEDFFRLSHPCSSVVHGVRREAGGQVLPSFFRSQSRHHRYSHTDSTDLHSATLQVPV